VDIVHLDRVVSVVLGVPLQNSAQGM
jgi:hypothetical protein